MESLPDDQCDQHRHLLSSMVVSLDNWAWSIRQARSELRLKAQSTQYRHDSLKLLRSVRLACRLRGGGGALEDIVKRSLALALPSGFHSAYLQGTGERGAGEPSGLDVSLPSASQIRRSELSLDIAIILLTRRRNAFNLSAVRSCLIDSSPLAGYGWIWSQYAEVAMARLVETFEAFCSLRAAVGELLDRPEGDGDVLRSEDAQLPCPPEWQVCHHILKTNIFEVISTPCALGSGHRGLPDKVCAEVYKMALNTPPSISLSQMASTFTAYTGDMGVEMGIPDFRISEACNSLLPPWIVSRDSIMDVEVDAQEPDVDGPLRQTAHLMVLVLPQVPVGMQPTAPTRRICFPGPSLLPDCSMSWTT